MNRIEEVQSFVQTVDAGSITQAAARMRVAKSSVSRHIAALEQRLGVQLLNRTTRRMSLTPAGKQLYEASSRLLDDFSNLESSVRAADSALSGRIRISAPSVFGPRYVGPALLEFLTMHPDIEFDVEFTDRQIDILQEDFDLAIRVARLSDSRLKARRIATLPTAIAASPDYWQQYGKPRRPGDLAKHRCLHYSDQRTAVWRFQTPSGRAGSVRITSALQANNGEFLTAAAERGLGVIRQPRFMLAAGLDAKRLEIALDNYRWSDLTAYVLYPETRHLPRRIRALIDFIAVRWRETPIS